MPVFISHWAPGALWTQRCQGDDLLLAQMGLQNEAYLSRVASVQVWVPSALLVQKLHISKAEKTKNIQNNILKVKLSLMNIEFQFCKVKKF